jgi:hypothetical protein
VNLALALLNLIQPSIVWIKLERFLAFRFQGEVQDSFFDHLCFSLKENDVVSHKI